MIPFPMPPWTGLGRKLESSTRKALYDFKMLDGVSRLGLALSGGKDSLTMLFLLHAISGRGFPPFQIVGFHVGGETSCGASVGNPFLIDFCRQMNIPLVTQEMPPFKGELECYSCSRRRRRLLFDMAKKEGCSTIAFGHHRDDNAQTVLMNLLHKGEFAGLLPKLTLYKYGVTIIRPLIYLQETDITIFAKHYGFQRITCRCPAGQHSLRKKTDLLLTSLSSLYPNARSNVSHASLLYGSHKAQKSALPKCTSLQAQDVDPKNSG
jgi:tRNA(Ile)-lysidine synthase TilS/MesJ